jgi:hypothetical protein
MKKLAAILLLLSVTVAQAQPSYWWTQLQRKPDAAQSQAFWFVPGQNVFFTYATNHVIINATGGGGTTNVVAVAAGNFIVVTTNGSLYTVGLSPAITNLIFAVSNNVNSAVAYTTGVSNNVVAAVAYTTGVSNAMMVASNALWSYTTGVSNSLITASNALWLAIGTGGGSNSIHPTVTSWSARVVANGGTNVSLFTRKAVSTFCYGLDAYNLTSQMIAVNCMVPDSLIALCTPLIVGGGSDPWVNMGFTTGNVTVNGLLGNGGGYLRTGLLPSVIYASVNDNGLTFYCYNNPSGGAGTEREIAATPAGGASSALLVDYQGTTYFDAYTDGGSGRISLLTPGTTLGFFSGSRTDSSHEYLYYGCSPRAFSAVAGPGGAPGASLPAIEYYVMAQNNNGAPADKSNKTASFVAFHHGLSATQTEELYTLVQAMRVALLGGWK